MRFLLLLVLLLVAACASPDAESPPSDSPSTEETNTATFSPDRASTFVARAVEANGLLDRAAVVAALGEPSDEAVETRPSEHAPGTTDTLRTLTYPGLRTTVYTGAATGTTYLLDLVVTDAAVALPHAARVGQPMSEVQAALGDSEATVADADAFVYPVGDGETAQTRLIVDLDAEGERVETVRYSFFYD